MFVFKEILSPESSKRASPASTTMLPLESSKRASPASSAALPLEITLLAAHQHPFIIRFIEVIYDTPSSGLGLVTEFCDQGDLHTLLAERRRRGESVPEAQLLTWLVQICCALAHLHRQGILHRE